MHVDDNCDTIMRLVRAIKRPRYLQARDNVTRNERIVLSYVYLQLMHDNCSEKSLLVYPESQGLSAGNDEPLSDVEFSTMYQ